MSLNTTSLFFFSRELPLVGGRTAEGTLFAIVFEALSVNTNNFWSISATGVEVVMDYVRNEVAKRGLEKIEVCLQKMTGMDDWHGKGWLTCFKFWAIQKRQGSEGNAWWETFLGVYESAVSVLYG